MESTKEMYYMTGAMCLFWFLLTIWMYLLWQKELHTNFTRISTRIKKALQPRRPPIKVLCGYHAPLMRPGQMAVLDSKKCEVCKKSTCAEIKPK